MQYLGLVLYVFGFVFFCIAAWQDSVDRAKFISIGLAFCTAATIFGGAATLFGHNSHPTQ